MGNLLEKKIYLSKMRTKLDDSNLVHYFLDDLHFNRYIGYKFQLKYLDLINCIYCGKKVRKTFAQGYCFNCFTTLPQCDICILKPELCHYKNGTCRDSKWGEHHCFNDHYVYLANTSNIKIGITRSVNIPSRWIDQGAVQAQPIFKTNQRFLAGLIEVYFKKNISDKTSWQKMLKNNPGKIDLGDFFSEHISDNSITNNIKEQYGEQSVKIIK